MRAPSFKALMIMSIAPALAGLVGGSTISAVQAWDEFRNLEQRRALGPFIASLSTLTAISGPGEGVTSIQFVATGDPAAQSEMKKARQALDTALDAFKSTVAEVDFKDGAAMQDVKDILDIFGGLDKLRAAVDKRQIAPPDIVASLQPTAPKAMDLIQRIGLTADNPEIDKAISGIYALLQYFDGTHMEDGTALQALATGRMSAGDSIPFFLGVHTQALFVPTIFSTLGPSVRDRLGFYVDGDGARTLAAIRNSVKSLAAGGVATTPNDVKAGEFLGKRGQVTAAILQETEKSLLDLIDQLIQTAWRKFYIYCSIAVLIGTTALVAGSLLIRFMSRTLAQLSLTMTELAADNLNIEVGYTSRTDEIGAMARSVEVFREAAIRNRQLEDEAESLSGNFMRYYIIFGA